MLALRFFSAPFLTELRRQPITTLDSLPAHLSLHLSKVYNWLVQRKSIKRKIKWRLKLSADLSLVGATGPKCTGYLIGTTSSHAFIPNCTESSLLRINCLMHREVADIKFPAIKEASYIGSRQ